jgi:hypothetical protein
MQLVDILAGFNGGIPLSQVVFDIYLLIENMELALRCVHLRMNEPQVA